MKRDHKWLVRSDLVQITQLAIPVLRAAALADIDARNSKVAGVSITAK